MLESTIQQNYVYKIKGICLSLIKIFASYTDVFTNVSYIEEGPATGSCKHDTRNPSGSKLHYPGITPY